MLLFTNRFLLFILFCYYLLGDFPYEHVMNEDLLSFLMSGKRLDIPVGCSNEL
jgi:hypothetical protein